MTVDYRRELSLFSAIGHFAQNSRSSQPVFHLESKVEAPLTYEQLKRYRRHEARFLIAITKYPPEVTGRELDIWIDNEDGGARWHGLGWAIYKANYRDATVGAGIYLLSRPGIGGSEA